MPITYNLTEAKAVAEACRVTKLKKDLAEFGGEHTTLTVAQKQTERQAIIDASTTMQSDIQSATDIATLQGCIDTMNS